METLLVPLCVSLTAAACIAAYHFGRAAMRHELARAAKDTQLVVNADGQLHSRYNRKDGNEHGECLLKLPSTTSRAQSSELAKQILLQQGEEGAFVAEDVLAVYNARKRKVLQ